MISVDRARENLAEARARKIRAENELTAAEAAVDQAEAALCAAEDVETDWWSRT